MGPFTSNMYNHITLQAKGTAIYFTVKESYIQNQQMNKMKKKNHNNYTIKEEEEITPGAFSHISQRGTSLGSANPTLTCLLASLLHM